MSVKKSRLLPQFKRPLVFAHRGCSKIAPENTLAAFQAVLDNGVPGVEFDIHECGSGELVVIHDFSLKRVAGCDASVEDTPYDVIRELDAGKWFSEEFSGEIIPLLDEVLDLLGASVYYDIEIKSRKHHYGSLEKKLVETIRRRGVENRAVISSFDPLSLREIRRIDPELQTAHIYSNHPDLPWSLRRGAGRFICRPLALKPDRKDVNRWNMLCRSRIEGYPVIPWTVDDREEAERLLSLGTEGIISNVPETMQGL
ncbi:MAG: glycerophosphodiester phosphodiesterase family protein [Spirochaetota bacterium]|nr:glycerophosphodiester phosphodiesterase family protein [Spirochaetota bacterium]